MRYKTILCFIFITNFFFDLQAQGVGQGTRIDLTSKLGLNNGVTGQFAQLFIPDFYQAPIDGKFELVFHLHSASWAAEDEVYKANANAILFNIHLGGFSSSYQNYFVNQSYFQKILDTVYSVLAANGIIANPKINRLIITSFSAGYAGVRELLKNQIYYDMITAVNLADGLHCSSDPATRTIQMEDFVKFAKDARDKTKILVLTHSSILTSGYDNTTQTANYLISGIGTQRIAYSSSDEIGLQYSRCDTGYFHLKGYYGDTAADHLKHLYAMNNMLESVLNILDNQSTGFNDIHINNQNFILEQNYPNPFNPTTIIKFSIPSESPKNESNNFHPQHRELVSLKVYDSLGREVATLVNEEMIPGNYEIEFYANRQPESKFQNTASGVYYYRLQSNEYSNTKKMILLK